jgi:hypothetical protein
MPEPTPRGTGAATAVKGGRDRTEQVAVRLPTELLERLDEYVETLRAKLPAGVRVTRADGIRALLARGLQGEGPRFTTPWEE